MGCQNNFNLMVLFVNVAINKKLHPMLYAVSLSKKSMPINHTMISVSCIFILFFLLKPVTFLDLCYCYTHS